MKLTENKNLLLLLLLLLVTNKVRIPRVHMQRRQLTQSPRAFIT